MKELLKQIEAVVSSDLPLVTNLANISAILNHLGNINWCGFYLVKEDCLYLGPFQGEVACVKIPYGKGVCGTAFARKETVIVPNVNEFPGHIACSSLSKSEIVVPIIRNGNVKAVIDIDAPVLDRFHAEEKDFLEKVGDICKELFSE